MTDKKMPTNIFVYEMMNFPHGTVLLKCKNQGCEDTTHEYTLVHNNPDYHVIKKSDVDGDVMGALDRIDKILFENTNEDVLTINEHVLLIGCIRDALIAQSAPDIVRIPRKVLEGMKRAESYVASIDLVNEARQHGIITGYSRAINDVLNYKEGDDA